MDTMMRARGFTLVETIVAVALLGILSVSVAMGVSNYSQSVAIRATAEHSRVIREAAAKYINTNNAAVAAAATPTTPAVITTAQLAPFLPPGFSPVNGFGQNAEIRVLEPTPGRLQALMLTTGGEEIEGKDLRTIAQQIGAMGGYIDATSPTTANGTGGQWSLAVAPYGANPGKGHVAINLAMASDTKCERPDPVITTGGCPVGFTGTRTFTNTASCPSSTGVVQWSGPVLTGDTCVASGPPPPASCTVPVGTVRSWTVSGVACSAARGGTVASGSSLVWTDAGSPTTGSASYLCTNGTLAITPLAGATCVDSTPPPPTCVVPSPPTETQTLACASGQYGSITQSRTASCPSPTGSVSWTGWSTTSNTCVSCPANYTSSQWVPTSNQLCPVGQTGIITREKQQTRVTSYSCPAGTTSLPAPSFTPWTDNGNTRVVSSTCTASCVAPSPTSSPTTRAASAVTSTANDCGAGAYGSHTFSQSRTENGTITTSWTCPGPTSSTSTKWLGTFNVGAKTVTGGSCTTCPAPVTSVDKRWVPWTDGTCPAGQTGTIKREKEQSFTKITSYSCPAGTATLPAATVTGSPNWWADTGNWREVSNTCVASLCPPGKTAKFFWREETQNEGQDSLCSSPPMLPDVPSGNPPADSTCHAGTLYETTAPEYGCLGFQVSGEAFWSCNMYCE